MFDLLPDFDLLVAIGEALLRIVIDLSWGDWPIGASDFVSVTAQG